MKRSQNDVAGTKTLWRNGVVRQWHCIAAAVGKFSRCGGTAVLLRWQCSARPVAKFSHGSERTLLRRWENFAFQIDMLTPALVSLVLPFLSGSPAGASCGKAAAGRCRREDACRCLGNSERRSSRHSHPVSSSCDRGREGSGFPRRP